MFRHIRAIVYGCGYVPGYGSHPGTGVLVAFVIMGAIAGAHAGWRGAVFGAGAMLGVFGPMYLWGAHDRGMGSPTSKATAQMDRESREDT